MVNLEKIKSNKTIKELLEFGIININKPQNPTSFDVSDFVRKTLKPLGVEKTSHFGTLDPKVTGVLPIALNRACKLTGFFLGEDKEYIGIMRIHEEVSLEELNKIIKEKFLGKIKQIPPKKSRVARILREREINKFELLEKFGKDILFRADVQGGTYIRKLIDDLGKEIGGAHMLELRRVRAGIFKEENSVNLYDFEKAVEEYENGNEENLRKMVIPAEIVSEVYPAIFVKEESAKKLFNGKPISNKDLVRKIEFDAGKIVSIFAGERFIGMYAIVDSEEVFAKPKFVLQPIE
ncbi:MAG TPA: RNA-guided pseudouridylation complex pseudouridine synthase subunit Cbf5 [Candidatus Nanoarchaeia archaeon]|nr:RNA-guided pseudouridylation complex pseudouridine synthase subunit Cbf5 [Candidatus Nanoarchaeia archaeon]